MKKLVLIVSIFAITAVVLYGQLAKVNLSDQGFENSLDFPKDIKSRAVEGIKPRGHIEADVIKVTDGDTFTIRFQKKKYTVRMLYIDTPESVKKGIPVQAFSKEAWMVSREKLLNSKVDLFFESDLRDDYKRLLANVFTSEGLYLNEFLVKNGCARAVAYKPNTSHFYYFKQLETNAISGKKGLWSLDVKERPFRENSSGQYEPVYLSK